MTPLSQARTLALIRDLRAGKEEVLGELVGMHLPLVQGCLRRFQMRGRDMEELYQQGCLGLVKACRRFDPDYGVQFSTYAVPLILGEIRAFLRDDRPFHLPRQEKERLHKLPGVSAALAQALGREPTVTELAQALRMDPRELAWLQECRNPPISMEQALPGERAMAERIPDPAGSQWLDSLMLRDLIQRLPEQARLLIRLRLGGGRTQAQTARLLGVSQVQVSRLERRVQALLKEQWQGG